MKTEQVEKQPYLRNGENSLHASIKKQKMEIFISSAANNKVNSSTDSIVAISNYKE
jgi:hypothetical protein